jgi:hypothetical protein
LADGVRDDRLRCRPLRLRAGAQAGYGPLTVFEQIKKATGVSAGGNLTLDCNSDVNWGSSTQAHSYRNALNAMHRLQLTEEHVKNYRPQILVLCGNPVARPSLVDFASKITKEQSLLICGHVIVVGRVLTVEHMYFRLRVNTTNVCTYNYNAYRRW